ncbi:unnamed protein product [Ambrosiozyma monospora]|uniref:Unnamed protein product n=1 Tax=Ambrosiozyma monospora TaxID=43982 RepID=A0ACB5UAF5_AMBMO|nr:unnamed protein product [Ambrosiozyma monospora]
MNRSAGDDDFIPVQSVQDFIISLPPALDTFRLYIDPALPLPANSVIGYLTIKQYLPLLRDLKYSIQRLDFPVFNWSFLPSCLQRLEMDVRFQNQFNSNPQYFLNLRYLDVNLEHYRASFVDFWSQMSEYLPLLETLSVKIMLYGDLDLQYMDYKNISSFMLYIRAPPESRIAEKIRIGPLPSYLTTYRLFNHVQRAREYTILNLEVSQALRDSNIIEVFPDGKFKFMITS